MQAIITANTIASSENPNKGKTLAGVAQGLSHDINFSGGVVLLLP
jgi:hypothetical protein